MQNDEENKALNEQPGEDTSTDTTPVPETEAVEDGVEPQTEPTGEVEEQQPETTGEPKKGFQARVRELDAKAKKAEKRAKSLEEKLAELTNQAGIPSGITQPYNPQEPVVAPGEEIDVNELNRRIQERELRLLQQADSRSELRHRQSEAVTRINNEASEVIRVYPELDPDNENFNPELSDTITEATEAYVRAQPYTASVKTFVAKLMKPYQGAVNKGVGQATENIARQVSQAALRPTSVRKEEKTARDKTVAELEQELGIVIS